MEEVCIIGGGISGILSAKVCCSNNLIPFILEKTDSIGGVWKGSASDIGVWNSLATNTTQFLFCFSDHLWPSNTPEYPSHNQVIDYFNSYITKHDLQKYFQFNSEVTSVIRLEDNYSVTYTQNNQEFTKIFKYVICASGFYSRVNDCYKNKENFSGTIVHSGYYREPSIFAGKKVVVVGRAFSSGDIAFEALENASSVTQVFRKPYLCMERHIQGVSNDFYRFNIENHNDPYQFISSLEKNAAFVRKVNELIGNPGDIFLESWRIPEEKIGREYFNHSVQVEGYYKAVKSGQINCVQGEVKEFSETGLVLSNGQEIEADLVLLATGYYSNYSFFSDEIKEILKYDPKNQKAPLVLFRSTIHPGLPGLAFVGSFHGLFTGQFELQSELAVKWITGSLCVSQEELWEGVRLEEWCRTELKDACFVYDCGKIIYEYFKILGVNIDYEFLASLGYQRGPFCPVFFWPERPGQKELIIEVVKRIKQTYPHYNFSNSS